MSNRDFKARLYAEFALVGRALASPHRLELLDLLAQGERSVDELAGEANLTLANASAHLQVLLRARLVETDKRGLHVFYRLASPGVFRLWQALRDVGSERLAEIDRLVATYLSERRELRAVTKEELLRRLEQGAAVVLDVRPDAEYRQGHISGARSVPLDQLEQRLAELPADAEIVAYCRGPFCVMADDALRVLHRHGRRAVRLSEGFPEWRAAGYPTRTGAAAGAA